MKLVRRVTAAHGNRFAEEWYRGQIEDACDATGVLQWPDDWTLEEHEEQDRHHDLTDEICRRVFESVKDVIAKTFVRIAAEVVARERNR